MSAACPTYGIRVDVLALAHVSPDQVIELFDDFRAMLGAEGMAQRGAPGDHGWTSTITRDGSQATDADRQTVASWFEAHREALRADVSDIADLATGD